MSNQPTHLLILAAVGALLLGGCAEFPGFGQKQAHSPAHPKAVAVKAAPQKAAPAPAREASAPHERDDSPKEVSGLREGIRLYNDGDFDGAIRRLSARDVNSGPLGTRLMALKYTAFSYCVTSRPGPCRQSFDKALHLDPSFDLAPGEHGHPLWGPVFTQAKQAAGPR
jgi:hypothetical protein